MATRVKHLWMALVAGVALAAATPAHAQGPWVIQDIGTLGGLQSEAYGINVRNQVVGRAQTASGAWHAFLWTAGLGMVDLGTLGGSSSLALAINTRGQVTGSADLPGGSSHAFLWSASTGMVDLGTLPGETDSVGYAINDRGTVVGSSSQAQSARRPFQWDVTSGPRLIPVTMPATALLQGAAVAINNAGQVAGHAINPLSAEASMRGGTRNEPRIAGPSLFTRFMVAKYFGGSGWPASTLSTNSCSVWQRNAQLNRRS